ncbi:NAD(P)-binding domain-containing protein [Lacisediminihabitans profunda]|uniref:NADPH-dependent L-lysine N(6)-monooxygenase n=1 Tax=Lacisediminihabitans profunda TaxID=2594790 RepID=A0A5C8UTH8_9MICO|nr:NAD(P)-binding domain-containing protein [Lacisediminihabitans profunda]TXN31904.1 NADPH-dependent L-lysine N(6)-monooxygenase [Lacisediminihabitans profunda]
MTLIDLSPTVLRSPRLDGLPVAIIGSGPIGLAAAANLVERGIDFVVYEAGGAAASSLAAWGHIRLFSPWRHLIDPAARRLLGATGWTEPDPDVAPYAAQLIDLYLAPLAALPEIRSRIRFGSRVQAVTRQGMDRTRSAGRSSVPFALRLQHDSGEASEVLARAVIDASGTYSTPKPLGSNGLAPLGLVDVADWISSALPDVLGRDRARFAGRHTVVVGAGHSAANTLIALAKLAREEDGTTITWLIRNDTAARVSATVGDELPGRASLADRVRRLIDAGAIGVVDGFEIDRVARTPRGVAIGGSRHGTTATVEADEIVAATGFRPDLGMLSEIRLDLDDIVEAPRRLAPLIDPNVHSCGTVEPHGFAELQHPEPNFFIAGMKSYGRAPTFLLATGYEQVRSIVAWLDGDFAGASAVKLVLPATGVCSTGDASSQSCC